jgi:2-isopropylmalate synthase
VADNRVLIFDTSLRDGEQAPGCSMTVEEKLRLAHQLESLGVDIIEAGFPVASAGDFEAVQRVSRGMTRASVAALARCRREDISLAWEAVREARHPRLHTFLATSDIHLAFKLKITREECLRQVAEYVRYARSFCPDVEFSPEDATRSEVEFLCRVLQVAVEAGASTLNIPDTVGYTTPGEFAELIRAIKARVKGVENTVISVHCHNDLGSAVANSLAGVEAGARQVECTVNGIGERAGNAALEEVVMAMFVRADRLPFTTAIRRPEIHSASRLLSDTVGFQVQPNKAIVGRNAFAHEAGIHQHGVLSNPLCYEIMTPESVGVAANNLVLGKHSGRHALLVRYQELGFQLSKQELQSAYERFTQLADRKKRIYDQDLVSLLVEKPATPSGQGAEAVSAPVAAGGGARSTAIVQ